ncbi:E3 ubiquitin-protein ligase CHIP [Acorus gramineus]|uniref:E3 ubiquitin-protein ligase CHIP n=1 Tax=Acorus gramineus TaxID=55184 RepID=A0AAV9AGI6_ACOGR|nr:E3 ubiquitin-protein ligase CHIP [Acorus gramineus]
MYTEAITLCPYVPEYYTNRALCFRKRNVWKRVEEDCTRAIELDHKSVKAHYMLGLALLEREEYAGGIQKLEKALDFGRVGDPEGYMVEEIWQRLAKAKYTQWEEESNKRVWRLQELKKTCEKALKQHHFLEASQTGSISEEAADAHAERMKQLDQVFEIAAESDTPTEIGFKWGLRIKQPTTNPSNWLVLQVPDYLCCKITLDIFRDPVISPSGVTYERAMIVDHLNKVGKFDPFTREPLELDQLVPNLAIKEALQAFLNEHGWAYRT